MRYFQILYRLRELSISSLYIITALGLVCLCLAGCDTQDDPAVLPSDSSIISTEKVNSQDQIQEQRTFPQGSVAHSYYKADWPRIVALGNSLTAGLGVSPDESYPSQLQRRLDHAGYHYRVINAGVSGDTTAGAVRRLDWVLKSRPSIVILELGGNDGLRGHSLEDTYANLKEIIRRLQTQGVTIVLTGMKIPPNYGIEYTSKFSAMYERLAKEFNVTFMPFFLEGVAARRELNQADGIHPTTEGYQIIVDNLLSVLKPLLKNEIRVAS